MELLAIILIIAILATFAVIALFKARVQACDSRRVADIKQIQTALELYFYDANSYPKALPWGGVLQNRETGKTFMERVPQAPSFCVYGDACKGAANLNYDYISADVNQYRLNYCLDVPSGGNPAGPKFAKPGVIDSVGSANSCTINEDCVGTGTCQGGLCLCGSPGITCPTGQRCNQGVCGIYCFSDAECANGLGVCDNFVCR